MVLAAAVWGHQWEGSFVMCHSDNTTVVSQVNSLHSQDPVAGSMLCCLAYFQAHFDFQLRAVHIGRYVISNLGHKQKWSLKPKERFNSENFHEKFHK